MTELSGYDWLRLHTLRRWIDKMERDGPVPGLLKPQLAAEPHKERIATATARVEELRQSLMGDD